MSDNISAQELFKSGLTREQFIQKYSELQKTDKTKDSSIFSENFANSLGQIFDTLNTNGNDTLDENEITTLQGLGDNDNKTLSETDLKVLYEKMGAEIIKKHSKDVSPEQSYKNATANGDIYSNTYVQDLGQQISILQELISLRKLNSTNIQQTYQSQIDDIVKKDSNLTTEQKTEYIKLSNELQALQRQSDSNDAVMKKLEIEIQNNENEIKLVEAELEKLNKNSEDDKNSYNIRVDELSRLQSKGEDLNFEYSNLKTKKTSYNAKILKTKSALDKKNEEILAGNPDLKIKIEMYKNLIDQEKNSCKKDIDKYSKQVKSLQEAQTYAIDQIKNAPAPSFDGGSGEASHKNDNLMSFDELKAKGLKYSGDKGQKLAGTIQKHLKGFTGYCSRHVSNALNESGLGKERTGAAADMDTLLEKNKNFKEIKVSSAEDLKRLPAGCILVYERGAARYNPKYGHIEVTLGDGTAGSDGRTRNLRYTDNMSVFVPVENA